MWEGPGQGPRGGPPFRGDQRGEMFAGRDGPMPDFRGRDGMNMGPGPLDLPPMDMRRGDGPPMRGRDMERDMRGRDQNRDFFRPDGERDLSLRRQYEMSIRDKLMTAPGFMGPGRNSADTEERGMPQREPMNRLMDMRDREMIRYDMPGFNNQSAMDGRRGFPLEPMGRNDGFRDMRDRPPMGRDDIDGCDMDTPSRDRRMMDFDRRGGPPFNARGGFDSDMDFRNRPPGPEFRGRDRSPIRFGNNDRAPVERGRSGMPPDAGGPNRPDLRGAEGAHRDREFLNSTDSPPIDHYRSGEEMTLAEEWKNRRKEKPPVTDVFKGMMDQNAPPGFGRESILGAPPPFNDRERPPTQFPGKDAGFPHDQFPARDLPSAGLKAPLDLPFPEMGHPGLLGRAPDSKLWRGELDPKQIQNAANCDGRPPYHQDKNEKIQGPPSEGFKGLKAILCDQRPVRPKMGAEPEFQSGSAAEGRDQDYRDIDYRTGSVRAFDYKHETFQAPEKVLKESKPFPPPKFSDSGSQDQDYRSASVENKVSNTISIIGIPKTATMEQILGAFAVRDGVPMQGMKIKSVVPGYSYDTAYVEFLNLDDAVHFMESNKGSLKVGAKTASMKYVQQDKSERDLHESLPKRPTIPQVQEALLPSPGELLDSSKNNVNGSQQAKELLEPLAQWQRNCDLTPEAWQQQVDQQLKQQEAELQAESWAGRNPPRHGPPPHGPPPHGDPIFKESKTMILKNVKPTTTVETILKALDPFAYLDERNVRLVKGKTPGAKCFCFVDMDSHEQVVRLVELLTKPRPLSIDGVRVYAEVAKPLKNQNIKRESDKPFTSLLGYPPDANMMEQPQIPDLSLQYSQHLQQAVHPPAGMQCLPPAGMQGHPPVGMQGHPPAGMQGHPPAGMLGDPMAGSMNPPLLPGPSYTQGVVYGESPAVDPSYHQALPPPMSGESAGLTSAGHGTEGYIYGSETPDMSGYLYDGTSGFFYDPQTTLYYDPNSRYFYNSQTQEYLYWDGMTKTYIPVPSGGSTTETTTTQQPLAMSAEVQAILANPAADAPLEMKKPTDPTPSLQTTATLPPLTAAVAPEGQPPAPDAAAAAAAASTIAAPSNPTPESALASTLTAERREDEDSPKKDNKEEKPRSLAAVKIMKDMERWAKIQNRQKDAVRSPSPVLKPGQEDKKSSKAADAGFAIFAKAGAGDDLFKKPLAPPKKDEKGKRPMGSLGLLASDYGAGSDEEVEEEKQEAPKASKNKSDDKDDKLTDWKKMACLLCRRQFPNKDALIRHQQLSDLHKQNMEIHLKIKRSKKELEALENQEKELIAKDAGPVNPPEPKKRKHHQQQHHHNTWAGSSKDSFKGSERPGLGAEPVERKKKEPVVWDHATYKQAVRKAMFARFKELE